MVAPIIFVVSVFLYVSAIWLAIIRGPDTFLPGLLAGCGSISMGVWMGFVVAGKPELLVNPRKPTRSEEDSQ
jgi:hypothetical protein